MNLCRCSIGRNVQSVHTVLNNVSHVQALKARSIHYSVVLQRHSCNVPYPLPSTSQHSSRTPITLHRRCMTSHSSSAADRKQDDDAKESSQQHHAPSATAIDAPMEKITGSSESDYSEKKNQQYTVLRMLDDMGSGKLLKWHVNVGDHVDAGHCLCEIDTDVAEFEFNAQYDGYLAAQLADVGDELKPGQEIAIQVDHKEAVPYAQKIGKEKYEREHQHHHNVHKSDSAAKSEAST